MMDNTKRVTSGDANSGDDEPLSRIERSASGAPKDGDEETGYDLTVRRERIAPPSAGASRLSAAPPPSIPDVELRDELGRGGQGVVYRARQTYLDRDVAVKVLLAGAGGDFEQRFRREARILAGLQDPHIVACHQAGLTDDGRCYLVMEFIDGPDLAHWIERHGKLTVRDALVVTRDIARALAHAQSVGIIHRDVKPQNVLLAPHGDANARFPYRAKLVDLGLARGGAGELALTQLTAPGAIMGTPSTMAPEQFDDSASVDFRADVYGLGCVLYHALAGECAYSGRTLGQVIRRKSSGASPDPRRSNPEIPASVARLVSWMLAAQRDDRPTSYHELLLAIDTELERLDAPRWRERVAPAARPALVAALALSVVVGIVLWPSNEEPAPMAHEAGADARDAAVDGPLGASGSRAPRPAPSVDPTNTALTPFAPPRAPAGARWRPFEAWSSLEELLVVDGWRRTQPDQREVWGCAEGDLGVVLANSPTMRSTALRALPAGEWEFRGELRASKAFGWEPQEARAGVRLRIGERSAFEWECSPHRATAILRWRTLALVGGDWNVDATGPRGARVLSDSSARFECLHDGGVLTLRLSVDEAPQPDELASLADVATPHQLELFVEGGMGQWSAFEFLFR